MIAALAVDGWARSRPDSISQQYSQLVVQQASQAPGGEPTTVQTRSGGYLGAYLGDLNGERAREFGLSDSYGAIVGRVEEGSPGQKAGLKENDVILSFNEQKIQNRAHFHRLLESSIPGSKVTLGISREGKPQTLSVLLGERRRASMDERERLFGEANAMFALAEDKRQQAEELKARGDLEGAARLFEEEKAARKEGEDRRAVVEKELREGKIQLSPTSPRPESTAHANRYNFGLIGIELGDQLAKFFNVTGAGVLVTQVFAGEPAERGGIKAGDCIVMINGERVGSLSDLSRIRLGSDGKEALELTLTIVRDRVAQDVKIKLDSR